MSAIQKMLLKNIDQEIDLVLIKQKQCDLDPFVRGHHTYMDIWIPNVGDENFCLKSENENQHLQSAFVWLKFEVAIAGEERIENLTKIFRQVPKVVSLCFEEVRR